MLSRNQFYLHAGNKLLKILDNAALLKQMLYISNLTIKHRGKITQLYTQTDLPKPVYLFIASSRKP
jgi:hypothetical protein